MTVRMELSRIFIRELSDMQIIELTEAGGERTFPIVIGLPEAAAIERRLKGSEVVRPQTHDLLASVIRHLGGKLTRIEIHDLSEGTFFANLVIDRDGEEITVDSRPSDAIALGIAERVPIFVAEGVLAAAALDSNGSNQELGSESGGTIVDFDDTDEDDE
ncbi:MAG: bifunctional nuclease family protein [Phycisphaerae bacterium]|nr:bifunctional nuclease family protein [Phycisphaerae bacterium]